MYKAKEDIAIAREIISCPGDTLAEQIEFTGMTQAELAERMGWPKKTIFAEECLMSRKEEKEIMVSGGFEKEEIKRLAAKIGTHPAIVAGRLANRGVMKQHIGNGYGFYK